MRRLIVLTFAGIAFGSGACWAQGYRPAGAPTGIGAARQRPAQERPAPAAVPGSRADSGLSGPAERTNVDMPPTEALFDSINRGDLAGAKEAVNRGADLNGHNVLGLTPLELAIDLGRNEISFLLLSLRGDAGYSVAGPPGTPAKPTVADRRAQREAERQAQRESAPSRRQAAAAPAAAPRNARLFAGNGGTPVPQAGFLGFDATR